jgi:hypothetical protein
MARLGSSPNMPLEPAPFGVFSVRVLEGSIASASDSLARAYGPAGDASVQEDFVRLSQLGFFVLMHYGWRTSKADCDDLKRLRPDIHEALFTNQNQLGVPYFRFPFRWKLGSAYRSDQFSLSWPVKNLCRRAFPSGATITHSDGRGPVSRAVAAIALFYQVREAEAYWKFDVPGDCEPARKPPLMVKGRFIV